tara:strand:- start:19 stop:204 length:186 start_codon:yes stop_codon:yes gene_type:complete
MAYPTNPIYKFIKSSISGENVAVEITQGNATLQIPFSNDNTDYQTYLEWKAIDGNEPEAAD